MNWQRLKNSGDPPPGTPAPQARWVLAHPNDHSFGDGQQIVELLLAGRDRSELSSEELVLLGRGYNWWGKHTEASGSGIGRETTGDGIGGAGVALAWRISVATRLIEFGRPLP
jgi:hypothetical protein